MEIPPGMICFSCSAPVPPSAYFCPDCGKPIRTKPLATSVSKQVIIYLISFFIAPFGLWYAWKYLKQNDRKSKIIGLVATALTIFSLALTFWTIAGLVNSVQETLRSLHELGL
jgi:hypothetical protein